MATSAMDRHIELQTFLNKLGEHWISAVFLLITLATILIILGIRWSLRRRWKRVLEEKFNEVEELDMLRPIGPQDQAALDLIKQFRQEIWELTEVELQLSIETLTSRAVRIVRSIAAVYHPEMETPEYEASLVEVLQMIRRVSGRLFRLATVVPFRFLGTRKLSDYQRYYQVYRKINENPIMQVLKRNPHIYKVAKWAMNVKNLSNPLYWAGKELSREGYFYVLRWFYLTFVSQIGREAMRLYSGRHFQSEEDRDATLVCYRLFALTKEWEGPSALDWSVLVDYIGNHPALESEIKLHILSRCSQDRIPEDIGRQELQTKSGSGWYKDGLKRLLEKDPHPIPYKKRLIERELADLG